MSENSSSSKREMSRSSSSRKRDGEKRDVEKRDSERRSGEKKEKEKGREDRESKQVTIGAGVEMDTINNNNNNNNNNGDNNKSNNGGKRKNAKESGKLEKQIVSIFAKKARVGETIHGAHLNRLVRDSGLSASQVKALANEFVARVPGGKMTLEVFKKELTFEKGDEFGNRLFHVMCSGSDELQMDEFIAGVARFAPTAKLDKKIDACYDLFDVDKSGEVTQQEFTEVANYSLRQGKVGVGADKLKALIDAEWGALDANKDGSVTREEFESHMIQNKEFVNRLTIHVPWIQDAFRKTEAKFEKRYLDTEPMITVLMDCATAVGAKTDDANRWNSTLRDNYYTDVNSLREMTIDDWTAMQMPRRLFTILKQKIDLVPSSESVISNRVARKVFKLRHNVMFHLQRKKLQLIWGTLYFFALLALVAWTLVKFMTPRVGAAYHGAFQLMGASLIVSRVGGALLKFNFALMLLPVCHRTLTWMRETKFDHYIPIDSLMFFHRFVGMTLLGYSLFHVGGHIANFNTVTRAPVDEINSKLGSNYAHTPTYAELYASRTFITGWIMVACMLILVPMAMEKVRRTRFNQFFASHHLYILIYICLPLHDGLLFGDIEIIYWLIPGFILFLVDRGLTVFRGVKTYEVLPGTQRHKGDVLEFRMEIPPWFDYSAGHYTWINCPAVSPLEWHPFTLTSSPDQEYLSVHINTVGDWTRALANLCAPSKDSKSKVDSSLVEAQTLLPRVRIDGPYGTASGDVFRYSHVVLVGGGIGVTPFVSMLKSIAYNVRFTNNCPLHAVHFVWVAKTQEHFEWFIPVLRDILEHEDLQGFFKISIYLTGNRYAINDIRLLGMTMLIKRAKLMFGEDLVTGLEASTTFGRPDFQKILLQHNSEWTGNKVGVFFCGPEPLANSIKLTCAAVNKANRRKGAGAFFNFKQEFF